jgi:hypothetical protein
LDLDCAYLDCNEHVSDTDSTPSEDDVMENRVFPQQRFSPVMKHLTSVETAFKCRPKPVKPAGGRVSRFSSSGVGKLRPAGRMRVFYRARMHLTILKKRIKITLIDRGHTPPQIKSGYT